MKRKTCAVPSYFVDSLPNISNSECKEMLRSIEIKATASDIFV